MRNVGAASLYLFLFIVILVIVIGLVPIPHYQVESGWYNGPSFFQRMMGITDPGIAGDKIYYKFAEAKFKSPMQLTCQTDLDCKVYKVLNQCQSYCGNSEDVNAESAEKLSKNRVCDPSSWSPSVQNCRCVLGSCIDLAN